MLKCGGSGGQPSYGIWNPGPGSVPSKMLKMHGGEVKRTAVDTDDPQAKRSRLNQRESPSSTSITASSFQPSGFSFNFRLAAELDEDAALESASSEKASLSDSQYCPKDAPRGSIWGRIRNNYCCGGISVAKGDLCRVVWEDSNHYSLYVHVPRTGVRGMVPLASVVSVRIIKPDRAQSTSNVVNLTTAMHVVDVFSLASDIVVCTSICAYPAPPPRQLPYARTQKLLRIYTSQQLLRHERDREVEGELLTADCSHAKRLPQETLSGNGVATFFDSVFQSPHELTSRFRPSHALTSVTLLHPFARTSAHVHTIKHSTLQRGNHICVARISAPLRLPSSLAWRVSRGL